MMAYRRILSIIGKGQYFVEVHNSKRGRLTIDVTNQRFIVTWLVREAIGQATSALTVTYLFPRVTDDHAPEAIRAAECFVNLELMNYGARGKRIWALLEGKRS